jgi:hypothetical protein
VSVIRATGREWRCGRMRPDQADAIRSRKNKRPPAVSVLPNGPLAVVLYYVFTESIRSGCVGQRIERRIPKMPIGLRPSNFPHTYFRLLPRAGCPQDRRKMLVGNIVTCQSRSFESIVLPPGLSEYLAAESLAPGLCPEVQSNQGYGCSTGKTRTHSSDQAIRTLDKFSADPIDSVDHFAPSIARSATCAEVFCS